MSLSIYTTCQARPDFPSLIRSARLLYNPLSDSPPTSMAAVNLSTFPANLTLFATDGAFASSELNLETILALTFGASTLIASIISIILAFLQLRRMWRH